MKDNIKEDMEYTTEDMEEINSLIEEIDMYVKMILYPLYEKIKCVSFYCSKRLLEKE